MEHGPMMKLMVAANNALARLFATNINQYNSQDQLGIKLPRYLAMAVIWKCIVKVQVAHLITHPVPLAT